MDVIEAPHKGSGDIAVFMAGGITGCPDWQTELIRHMKNDEGLLYNPRRKNFNIEEKNIAREQIEWEHMMLNRADAVLFWFPCETICPIVLYELGAWSMTKKPIFVGAHQNYVRRQDVIIQTELARPEVDVVDTIDELAVQLSRWLTKKGRR